MNRWAPFLGTSLFASAAFGLYGGSSLASRSGLPNPVVGAWLVKDPNAPFPYHMYVFNGDGTMQQANPDAGDPHGSDSDGKGIWVTDGERIKGKWVEVIADRTTHQFAGRLEISYDIMVSGDSYTGTETVRSYDAVGNLAAVPATPAQLHGKRVKFPWCSALRLLLPRSGRWRGTEFDRSDWGNLPCLAGSGNPKEPVREVVSSV